MFLSLEAYFLVPVIETQNKSAYIVRWKDIIADTMIPSPAVITVVLVPDHEIFEEILPRSVGCNGCSWLAGQ